MAFFGEILVATVGSELHDFGDTGFKEFELLSSSAISYSITQIFQLKVRPTVLRERCVEFHALKDPQCSEPVRGFWDDDQLIAI